MRTEQDWERYRKVSEAIKNWSEDNTNEAKTMENTMVAESKDGSCIFISKVSFNREGRGLLVDYTFNPGANGKRHARRNWPFDEFKQDLQNHLDSWIYEKDLVPKDRERKPLSKPKGK